MEEHAQIIQNQKAIADALEYLIWKDWKLNMSTEAYRAINGVRAINGRPELLGTPKRAK